VNRFGNHLPKETMLVAWSGKIETFVGMAEKVGLTNEGLKEMSHEYRHTVEKLGFDPLTAAGLGEFGVDVTGPLGIAMVPSPNADVLVMLYVPMTGSKSGVEAVRKLIETAAPGELELGDAEESGHKVLWFRPTGGAHALSGCVEFDDGMFVVFPGDHRSSRAAKIEMELQSLVKSLASGEGEKLASSADFAAALKGCDNELFGAVFMPEPARQLLMSGDDEVAALIPALADLAAAGVFLREEGSGLHLTSVSVAREGVAPYGRERDTSALDFVLGQPMAGLHLAVDAERVLKVTETALAAEKWLWREYKEGMAEMTEELGLPPGTRLDQIFDGEAAFFLSELSENPEAIVQGILGLVGIADVALVSSAMDGLLA